MFENLKTAMQKHQITVKDLADLVRITENTMLGKLEGKTEFRLTEIKEITMFFRALGENTTVEELFEEEE